MRAYYTIIITVIFCIGLVGCQQQVEHPPEKEKYAVVQTVEVKRQAIVDQFKTFGNVEPIEKKSVYLPANRQVERIAVDEGNWVNSGEPLIVLASDTAQKNIANVRTAAGSKIKLLNDQLAQLNNSLEKARSLLAAGAGTKKAVDDLIRQRNNIRLQIGNMQRESSAQSAIYSEQIDDSVVRSPISGYVTNMPVGQGEVIAGNTSITVTDSDNYLVVTQLTSDQRRQLKKVSAIQIELESKPDQHYAVTVHSPLDQLTVKNGLHELELAITDKAADLFEGDQVVITFSLAKRSAALLPLSAIRWSRNQPQVFFVEDGKAHRYLAESYTLVNNMIEIKDLPDNRQWIDHLTDDISNLSNVKVGE